jgi:hypothetical protein
MNSNHMNSNQPVKKLGKTLSELHLFLKKKGLESLLNLAEEPVNVEMLLVSIGSDMNGRDYILQINYLPVPKQMQNPNLQSPKMNTAFMQFVVKLPVVITDHFDQETLDLLCRINGIIELPGFQFNPFQQRQLFFRYVHFSYEDTIDPDWLLSLMVYIRTVLDLFAPSIEDVSHGRTTVNAIIHQWQGATMDDLKNKVRQL